MKLDDYYKAECLLREIKKEEAVLERIKELNKQQKSERISDADIVWLIGVAYSGAEFAKRETEKQFKDL